MRKKENAKGEMEGGKINRGEKIKGQSEIRDCEIKYPTKESLLAKIFFRTKVCTIQCHVYIYIFYVFIIKCSVRLLYKKGA